MNNEEIQSYLPKENSWLKKRENGLLLTDYQITILKRNEINYLNYGSLKEILFDINEILDLEEDEELEQVAKELDEQNYYSSKKN